MLLTNSNYDGKKNFNYILVTNAVKVTSSEMSFKSPVGFILQAKSISLLDDHGFQFVGKSIITSLRYFAIVCQLLLANRQRMCIY